MLQDVNLAPGSAQLGDATLVINVADEGDYDWPVPTLSFQGNENARYILWNLASAGTVTLPEEEADTVWGTVYAQDARLADLSPANIELTTPAEPAAPAPAPGAGSGLASTGFPSGALVAGGAMLTVAGVGLLAASRRTRTKTRTKTRTRRSH